MTSLDEILHYLDTTSRVSCPSITCEQAAEIASWLRGEKYDYEHARFKLPDCGHVGDVACGFAWDCGREMAKEEASYVNLLSLVTDLERDKERRERIDAGLSVEANTTTWEEATGDIDPGRYEGTGKGFGGE